jgi:hypothetical protein
MRASTPTRPARLWKAVPGGVHHAPQGLRQAFAQNLSSDVFALKDQCVSTLVR